MRNLFRFIIQHHFLILFTVIEIFSLFLLFSSNSYQKVAFYNASQKISWKASMKMSNILDYFSLHYENRKLAEENSRLYNNLSSSYRINAKDSEYFEGDS